MAKNNVKRNRDYQDDEYDEVHYEPGSEIHHTDSGNARRLVNEHGTDIRYVMQWKSWYVWNNQYWERDRTGDVMRRAQETVKHIYMEAATTPDRGRRRQLVWWAMQSESAARLGAMVKLAQTEQKVVAVPEQFDAKPWLYNCRNYTIDLRSGEARKHRRSDMLTSAVNFDYDPLTECPTWLGFLYTITNGNQNLIDFLQRAIGYSLTGDVSEQVMFIAWGSGNNGKSTLLNVIRDLTGAYARTVSPDTLAASNKNGGSGPSSDIARLKGARFISAIETSHGQHLNESLIKQLTSSEPMTARFLNQEHFEFAPTWKLWLATNHKPNIRDTDNGIWRRIKLIPFTATIMASEEEKRAFPAKLRAELPGILHWAIQGCLEWQKHGLGIPAEVESITNTYRNEMDVLSAFLSECCVEASSAHVTFQALYEAYDAWCGENHIQQLGSRTFNARLRERGHIEGRGTGGYSVWRGIGINADRVTSLEGPDNSKVKQLHLLKTDRKLA